MKKLFLLMAATAMLVACGPSREERVNEILDFEDSVFEYAIGADPATADQLTDLYVAFADNYPTDSLTPQFLMKGAEMQSNVIHTERAIELFDRIINDYPYFSEVPMCYFLKGNAYDLNSQYEEAKAAYQVFVDKYPDHFMAADTRKLIPLVGMTPEEIFEYNLNRANDTLLAKNDPADMAGNKQQI
jgi:tetratricopeptide (TPR) repeat protein